MDQTAITEKLTEVFRDVFDDDTLLVSRSMTAEDVEEWDSLSHIRLIVSAEQAFGVRFTSSEITDLENVGEFIDLVAQKLGHG